MTAGERQRRLVWRSAALDFDSGLSWRARLAACVYCEYATGEGVLDPAPSTSTVAAQMGCAERTARKARHELEFAGWLSVRRRRGRPSRITLAGDDLPRHVVPGPEAPTPARTPARGATEPDNQKEFSNENSFAAAKNATAKANSSNDGRRPGRQRDLLFEAVCAVCGSTRRLSPRADAAR